MLRRGFRILLVLCLVVVILWLVGWTTGFEYGRGNSAVVVRGVILHRGTVSLQEIRGVTPNPGPIWTISPTGPGFDWSLLHWHTWDLVGQDYSGKRLPGTFGSSRELWIDLNPVVAVVLPILFFLGVIKVINWLHRNTNDASRCKKCGYDLRATPLRCPECGTVPQRQ